MSRSIPVSMRLAVEERAANRCEYFGIPQLGRFLRFHVEHIVSLKHGGRTVSQNLCLSCPECNFHKGSDVATFLRPGELTRFFNPRDDRWGEHFELSEGAIYPKTPIGEATARIFQFNTPERIIYRKELSELLGDY